MTRHARAVGLNAAKIGQRATLTTRFGNFEAAEIRLSQPGGEGVEASERACLAARLIDPKAPMEIASIACGSASRPLDRVAFACVLDHINYSPASDNRALNDFFLNAELARGKGCVTSPATTSPPRSRARRAARSRPFRRKRSGPWRAPPPFTLSLRKTDFRLRPYRFYRGVLYDALTP